jgi:hypothetical protein
MKYFVMHQHVRKRVLFCLFALFAVPLSMSVYGQTETSYSVVFSNSTDFKTKVEVPMVAALYRNDKDAKIAHTKDNSRWQISLKYDDPRWKDIPDGTVYWYIKSSGGVSSVRTPKRRIWTMAPTTVLSLLPFTAACSIKVWGH